MHKSPANIAGLLMKMLFFHHKFLEGAGEVFDEVQLALSDFVLFDNFDLRDGWRSGWEDFFYAESASFLADHERFRYACATGSHDQTFENLDALARLTLCVHVLNLLVDTDHHAGFHRWHGLSGFGCVGHRIECVVRRALCVVGSLSGYALRPTHYVLH